MSMVDEPCWGRMLHAMHNSGMGEIFRKVAAITPVDLSAKSGGGPAALDAPAGADPTAAAEAAGLASFEVKARSANVSPSS